MKEIFKNPLLWYIIIVLSLISWGATRLVKKIIVTVEKQQTMKKTSGKIERKAKKTANQSKDDYFSTDYSANTSSQGKIVTTVEIIYILPNNNILHLITTAENIGGRMKETEETVDFIINQQDDIIDDLIRIIVESGQKPPPQERERKIEPAPPTNIKKKV